MRLYKIIILWCILCSCAFASYLEGPFVNNVTSKSVIIWWKSYPPVAGRVFLENRVYKKDWPPFEIHINNLKPDTLYRYYVVFENGKRCPKHGYYKFQTAPKKDRPFKFAVIADSRGPFYLIPVREDILKAIFDDAKKRHVKFICFLGDMVYGYAHKETTLRKELRLWKDTISDIMHEIPVYTTMGNHDVVMHKAIDNLYGEYLLDGVQEKQGILTSEEIFADEFVNPEDSPKPETPSSPSYRETSYSFNFGASHFVFLNTDYWMACPKKNMFNDTIKLGFFKKGNFPGRIMDNQIIWLEKDLKKARDLGIKHIFIFGHQPIFPISEKDIIDYSNHASDKLKNDIKYRRKKIWSIFTKYNVDAAFFGHEHNYSRTIIKHTWQIITGGAGAPLYDNLRKDLPWSNNVKVFRKRYHYCVITVKGDKVFINVYGLKKDMKGFELIDHASI